MYKTYKTYKIYNIYYTYNICKYVFYNIRAINIKYKNEKFIFFI